MEQFWTICSSEPTSEPRDSPRLDFNLGNFRASLIFSEVEIRFYPKHRQYVTMTHPNIDADHTIIFLFVLCCFCIWFPGEARSVNND